MFYYDDYGWLTDSVNDERSTDVTPPEASSNLQANWTGFEWVLAEYTAPVPIATIPDRPAHTKMRRQAFINRFPKTADGISNKYSLIEMFLLSDSYAASLTQPVTGAPLHQLRALIITGTGALSRSEYVSFMTLGPGNLTEAEKFTGLLLQASIPVEFRLTGAERTKLLTFPITDAEAYE